MRMLRSAAVAASLAVLAIPAQAATTFNFFWTGDPGADPTITSSGDATAGASGTFVIDAGPNDVVGPANVLSFSLVFGTAGAGTFEMTKANAQFFVFGGTVSADGTSIAMRNLFVATIATTGGLQEFGCNSGAGGCELVAGGGNISLRRGDADAIFAYATDDAARASLRLTAQQQVGVIPLPATLPLLLGALGLLAVARRKAS